MSREQERFVQITATYNYDKVKAEVFALDEHGNVWQYGFLNARTAEHGWFLLSDNRIREVQG